MTQSEQEPDSGDQRASGPSNSAAPLIVGEVLFDCFSDEKRVMGGAPFNVAWNLQGFGLRPTLLTAVGDDADGRAVQGAMRAWGMDMRGMQVSAKWPTGKVEVELDSGQPTFHILPEQAYDDMRSPSFAVTPEHFSRLYLGSLAFRSPASRATIEELIHSGVPRFVDINIRQPWFDRQWLERLLSQAEWVKLNEAELAWITERPCETWQQIEKAVRDLRQRYAIGSCAVTRGSQGACIVTETDCISQHAPPPGELRDTVGAGDAFAAATIMGISCGRPIAETLEFASEFASRTCALQGATTADREHYQSFLDTLSFDPEMSRQK